MPNAQILTRNKSQLNLYYELYGHGPEKVIFIMGLSHPLYYWECQYEHFKNSDQFQICVFDNRGIGLSDAPSGRYTTLDMAHDTLGLLEHLGWTFNVHVVGLSMGGMIAQELVLLAPELFKSAVFISTFMEFSLPSLKAIQNLPNVLLQPEFRSKFDAVLDVLFTPKYLNDPSNEHEHLTNREYQHQRQEKFIEKFGLPNISLGQLAAVMTHKMTEERLKKLLNYPIHFLVITGSEDCVVRPENSFRLCKALKCKLEIFHDAGHGVTVEKKNDVNQLLETHFLEAIQMK